mgnify:FL=1
MKLENQNINIPNISVSDLMNQLTVLYCGAMEAHLPFSAIPTPFLWGPAGIGKSDGIKQLAEQLELKTGKRVTVTDVRLLLFSPVDLRGVPVADEHKQFTNWLKPRIFDMDPSENVVNILFLDELSAAPQSVQAAAYQITLDRRIGEHTLPENCIVIAAGNRTTDQSVSYKMPKALCNRLMHYNVQSDFGSWKGWATQAGIDSRIIGYLGFDNSKLCAEPESSDLAYPTPRSWTFVSNILKTLDHAGDFKSCHPMICACVGSDTAVAFETWCRVCASLPSADEILRGVCHTYPKTQDALYALTASLTAAVRAKADRLRQNELDNVCEYASHFPADFAMTFFKDLNSLANAKLLLMKSRPMQDWLTKNKNRL